jgi:hypothetical protein
LVLVLLAWAEYCRLHLLLVVLLQRVQPEPPSAVSAPRRRETAGELVLELFVLDCHLHLEDHPMELELLALVVLLLLLGHLSPPPLSSLPLFPPRRVYHPDLA